MIYGMNVIGRVHTCFREKFGTPRQAGLVPDAPGTLVFEPDYARINAVRELERFSHLWILFVFDRVKSDHWQEMVRPPRLGGNRKVGVFASRSPFRPNPIGMSAVRLIRVAVTDQGPVLHLAGVDMVDGTPVLDIKPYLPYADIVAGASGGFADTAPEPVFPVCFTEEAERQIDVLSGQRPHLKTIVTRMLELDPRPAYSGDDGKTYGVRLFDRDVKWRIEDGTIRVLSLDPVKA
ncbi:tRNA (N6-threonylcarbamoyladenosine(37)-N6)-methyltransferase TrmO [Desulfatiferula olefinivorans]